MQSIKLLGFVLSCISLSSCGNYIERKASSDSLDKLTLEKLSSDFLSVREAIFSARCTSCHQQYDSYLSVINELSAIQSAVASNRMPKSGGPLTENQKLILATWVAKGAPETAGQPNGPTSPVPLMANWKSISERITGPKCLVCHNPLGQAKFLDLSSRQVIFDQRNRTFGTGDKFINFDSPNESHFLKVLLDTEEPMPPSWSNIEPLTQEDIHTLSDWIKLGLP